MKYSIRNMETGEQLAADLTRDQVEAWWCEGLNSTRYSGQRVTEDGVLEVSEEVAAQSLKAEVDANKGVAVVGQGGLSLKLDHDGMYWMRQDSFRGAKQSLDASCTDARRLMAHWLGFVSNCKASA